MGGKEGRKSQGGGRRDINGLLGCRGCRGIWKQKSVPGSGICSLKRQLICKEEVQGHKKSYTFSGTSVGDTGCQCPTRCECQQIKIGLFSQEISAR